MYLRLRGMTLIDVLVGTAVAVLIFLGIFGLLRASAVLSGAAASKAAALAIASGRLEYIRSLPYASIGTVGGIPSGAIAQVETVTSDNVPYEVRTFISYYDDPKDGTGSMDSNGIQADYKRAKVTVSYDTQAGEREVYVVSTFAPPGIETTTGGGTLRVVVVDADGAAVPGAEVTVVNASTSPAVNVTTFTDFAGYALFPGAATSTGYRVSVTRSGWSTAKTYSQDSTNQNPTPGHLTIAGGQTTTGTFAIDELASVLVRSFTPIVPASWTDTFSDAGAVTLSGTSVGGGAVSLLNGGTGYVPSGSATGEAVAPSYLVRWHDASFAAAAPGGTMLRVTVLDGTGAPVPDETLPGNANGFTSSPIDLSNVSTTTHPSLMLRAALETSATTTTPSLEEWGIAYSRGPVPLPSVSFSLQGAKTIGSTVLGAPIYKTTIASSTGATASTTLSLEWDSYALTPTGGYTLLDACPSAPIEVLPGASMDASLTLATTTGNALRVYAKDVDGDAVPGAEVTVSRTAFSRTLFANACGFAYFAGLEAASYSVFATGGGLSKSSPSVAVSGLTTLNATLE